MRKYLALILFLFLFACPSHKPPVPPGPVPMPFCGDGSCDPGETSANCKRDCGTQTQPICNSNGTCETGETAANCPDDCKPARVCGDEALDPDCPKITRDHSQIIQLGLYVAWSGQEGFDEVAFFKLFKKANFVSVHGMSPWDNPCFYFLEQDPVSKRFLVHKPNLKWQEHVRKFFRAAAYYDVGIEWVFLDGYGELKWAKYKGVCKEHPLRWNDAHVDITGADRAPLFRNWNRQDFSNIKNWAWMMPTTDAKDNILSYRGSNELGTALLKYYFEFVFDVAAETRKEFPNFRFHVMAANEPFATTVAGCAPGKKPPCDIDGQRSSEVDSRTERLLLKMAADRGFKVGEYFRELYNPTTYNAVLAQQQGKRDTPESLDPIWMKKNADAVHVAHGLMEVHGIGSVKDLGWFAANGISLADTIPSADGEEEDDDYHAQMNGIFRTKPPAFDYKLWACYEKSTKCPFPWSSSDLNRNVQAFVPLMEEKVFR